MTHEYIEIDGSYGEGGGAILRIACALAILTEKPVRIFNIRKNRPKPGLRTQHLVGLQTLADISNGTLENANIGAIDIFFTPGKITEGIYTVKVDTAGSVGLILQIIQLACVQSSGTIILNVEGGATFGLWAPTLPYLEHVIIPQLARMGYNITVKTKRHGFYPKGGAKVQFEIRPPKQLKPLMLFNFGDKITEIKGISIASLQLKNQNVAMRQANAANQIIKKTLGIIPIINAEYVDALNPGSGICLWIKTDSGVILGSDIIGERGKPSEKIGTECAKYLCEIVQRRATVDRFFSDQIIPFMALAEGISIIRTFELTNHAKTNIWLVEKFLGKKYTIKEIDSLHEIKIENP